MTSYAKAGTQRFDPRVTVLVGETGAYHLLVRLFYLVLKAFPWFERWVFAYWNLNLLFGCWIDTRACATFSDLKRAKSGELHLVTCFEMLGKLPEEPINQGSYIFLTYAGRVREFFNQVSL